MDEFEILENQAKELFKAFPELEFKTIAAFTLIIGWLLTAKQAQAFVANNSFISQLGAGFAFGSFAIVQVFFLIGHYHKLSKVYTRLETLANAKGYSQVVVDTYKISVFLPISYAVINAIFCAAIIILVSVIGNA